MKTKHFAAIAAAVLISVTLAGCGNKIEKNSMIQPPPVQEDDSSVEDTSSLTEQQEDPPEEAPVEFEEAQITAKETKYVKFSKTYNAESGSISGKAVQESEREGYKGKGYVTNISKQSDWEIAFDLPASQYYNISITVASDDEVQNGIALNGEKISEFTTGGKGKFETFTFKNIHLEEGISKVSIIPENGVLDVDYVDVDASEDISKLSLKLKDPSLSNKDSGYNAKALYKYLCDSFGKTVILGQYDTMGTTYESDLIFRTTGKKPAIRFGDLMWATAKDGSAGSLEDELAAAEQWSSSGGIVGYMWNWYSPTEPEKAESFYAENTSFDLKKAVTKEKIADKTPEEIQKLEKEGKISKECAAVIRDIDEVSEQLARLRDNGTAVIWRPLQEASNGYFWWGSDEESYKWLWKLLYERQTKYHQLNNLIWVWSAQNASWYVGDSYCDVLSADVYSDSGSKGGQVNFLLHLQSISANKPIAMSECGSLPQIQNIADEKAMWSYIGQWGGNFIVDENGKLSEEHNSEADLITMYNNNLTVTADKLPDFISMANEIKEQEEKSATEKKSDDTASDSGKDKKDSKDSSTSDKSSESKTE